MPLKIMNSGKKLEVTGYRYFIYGHGGVVDGTTLGPETHSTRAIPLKKYYGCDMNFMATANFTNLEKEDNANKIIEEMAAGYIA